MFVNNSYHKIKQGNFQEKCRILNVVFPKLSKHWEKYYIDTYGQVSNNGHPNEMTLKIIRRRRRRIVQLVMSSILSGILLLNVIKICGNLYISPNHVSLSNIWFCHNFYLIYIFNFLWKNQFGQGQLKMLFICVLWTSAKDGTLSFNLARFIWN